MCWVLNNIHTSNSFQITVCQKDIIKIVNTFLPVAQKGLPEKKSILEKMC